MTYTFHTHSPVSALWRFAEVSLLKEGRLVFQQLPPETPTEAQPQSPDPERATTFVSILSDPKTDKLNMICRSRDAMKALHRSFTLEQKSAIHRMIQDVNNTFVLDQNIQDELSTISRELMVPAALDTPPLPDGSHTKTAGGLGVHEDVETASWFQKQWTDVKALFNQKNWVKGITMAATAIGAGWEKFQDYVGSAFAATVESLKSVPVIGGMFRGIEKFIGTGRMAFFSALSAAGIELPFAVASYARQGIDRIQKELSAAAKGFTPEKLSGKFVELLKQAQVTAENAKDVSKEEIDDVMHKLKEFVERTPGGGATNAPPEAVTIIGNAPGLTVFKNGSLEYNGKKWHVEKPNNERLTVESFTVATNGDCIMQDAVSGATFTVPAATWIGFVLPKLGTDQPRIEPEKDAKKIVVFVRDNTV